MGDLFRRGGPLNVRKTGAHQYSMAVTLPTEPDGRLSRACINKECSPGAFKTKPGTGITDHQIRAYCPYCRGEGEPGDFSTAEQIRYAKDVVLGEARAGVDRMIKESLGLDGSGRRKLGGGLISMEMSYKPGPRQHIRRPAADQIRRDVLCPHCGLDHSVFGLARWCPDCGQDIFLTHVEAEFEVVRKMIADIERREELLREQADARWARTLPVRPARRKPAAHVRREPDDKDPDRPLRRHRARGYHLHLGGIQQHATGGRHNLVPRRWRLVLRRSDRTVAFALPKRSRWHAARREGRQLRR